MILACQSISKSYGINKILNNVSFHIENKEKIAIVGINGSGKTTLLKIIMGEETPDSGQVIINRDTTIGYLSQHQDISFDNTIYNEMLDTKKYILEMEEKIRQLELEMKHTEGEELKKILETYNRLSSRYDMENGYAYESEIAGVLKGLGFDKSDYDRHINTLSGGQKMRIAIGRLLLTRPDIIVLDEPTNHLDVNSTAWLEGFLASYSGSVIIVSHDRYFIDKIATKIIEIDNSEGIVYHGNYTYYSKKRAEIRASRMKAYLNQQAEIKHQEEVIAKLKQFNREKSIKRAESREKMLNKIEVLDKPEEVMSKMRLSLSPSVESGGDVLTITELSKSFGQNTLFSNLDMEIKRGEHVALIGDNGTGKTTILKIINRIIPKDGGSIVLGSRVRIGYYDQEHQVLSLHKTIFEEISDSYPDLNNTKIRNVLAAFLFTGEDVFKKISDLSGGERGRVSLAKLMLSPANFLILDEPTNHLDIDAREALETALAGFEGTILAVSHDRYFINKLASRIVYMSDTQAQSYLGNYDYFLEKHITETEKPTQAVQKSSADDYKLRKQKAAKRRKLENDIKRAEEKIADLEIAVQKNNELLSSPEIATDYIRASELSEQGSLLQEELDGLYSLWEAYSAELADFE